MIDKWTLEGKVQNYKTQRLVSSPEETLKGGKVTTCAHLIRSLRFSEKIVLTLLSFFFSH